MMVLGHDIGLMVAYAYAARCPDKVSKAILMAAFPPRVGEWTTVCLVATCSTSTSTAKDLAAFAATEQVIPGIVEFLK
jgi:pimeloyl-ACP methyl ester carboxylesterase